MFLIPQIAFRQTEKKGRGVFATDVIEAGTVIGDYLGIIQHPSDTRDEKTFYDMYYSDLADIMPADISAEGVHLMNHGCTPTCGLMSIRRHGVFFALRKIFPGEELTYDYIFCRPDTPTHKDDACHCGSAFCRGTIYLPDHLYAVWEAMADADMASVPEEPPVPYGSMLPKLDSYPEHMEDHLLFPMMGSLAAPPCKVDTSLLADPAAVRALLRTTGRRILLPENGMLIEGMLPFGKIVLRKATEEEVKAVV